MSEVVGPTDINSCIFADVSALEYSDHVSKLNLFIEVTSEECIDELAQGSLYVRGLCVASSPSGATSETFVLGVVASESEVNSVQKCTVKNDSIFLRDNSRKFMTCFGRKSVGAAPPLNASATDEICYGC